MWDINLEPNNNIDVDLSQVGMTPERLKERRSLIGASDMPIIMGDSPYMTPYELWLDKTNKTPLEQTTNFAIERGNRWEDRVRQLFEKKSGMEFYAKNFTHPENPIHSASLDGYNAQYKEGLEIKVTSREVLKEVAAGRVPEKYKAQVQWQIYVADLKKNNFFAAFVDKNEKGVEEIIETSLTVVYRDNDYIEKLINAADAFWTFVESNTAPPLTDKDSKELKGHAARKDFAELKRVKQKLDDVKQTMRELESVYKFLQNECIKHMDHAIVTCEGVKLQKIVRKGSIDYKEMSESEKNIIEKYRKPDTISYRVDLIKSEV